MRRRWRPLWSALIGILFALVMGAGCEMGAGIDCTSDSECEGGDHYCAECGKCVLKDNAESEAFWCSKIYERQAASGGGGGGSCGSYSDRGLYDVQVKSFCQAAYSYTCQGNTEAVKANCDTLGAFSAEGKSKCPYCDSY